MVAAAASRPPSHPGAACQPGPLLTRDDRKIEAETRRPSIEVARQLAQALQIPAPEGPAFLRFARGEAGDAPLRPDVAAGPSRPRPLPETLREHLRDRQLLLVLDNFEQVLAAALDVAGLLGAARELKVLVTSRAPLHLRGEREYALAPFTIPRPPLPPLDVLSQYDAVRLLVERAPGARGGFQVTETNAPVVAEICARLDGLPLAIELAAARVKTLTPEDLLRRLEQRIPGRLQVLTGGACDLPTRHQTLRAAIDWSYNLLPRAEQQLFARAGVFRGGWTLAAAEAIAGDLQLDVLDGLQTLVDHSLVVPRDDGEDERRFDMLETMREYALDQLEASGEAAATRRRHLRYFLELAETAAAELRGPHQVEWLRRLEQDDDNLRIALRGALDVADAESAARIAVALSRFWYVHGHLDEGLRWLDLILSCDDAGAPVVGSTLRARILDAAASLTRYRGDLPRAQMLYGESLRLWRTLGDEREVAATLRSLGVVAINQREWACAVELLEESLEYARKHADLRLVASSLCNLGLAVYEQGDTKRAPGLFEESLDIVRVLGDEFAVARLLDNLGCLVLDQGDNDRAQALLEESLAIARKLGDPRSIVLALSDLGAVALERHDYSTAMALYKESLALRGEIGDPICISLDGLAATIAGALASQQPGRPEEHREAAQQVARLFGYAELERETNGMPRLHWERRHYESRIVAARGFLDDVSWTRGWCEGRMVSAGQMIAYAEALRLLAEHTVP